MNLKRFMLPKIRTASACTAGIALALAGGQRTLQAQGLLEGTSGITYSGQATVVDLTDIHNFPSPIVICDTGPLASGGGFLEATVTETNVDNGALTFNQSRATCSGNGVKWLPMRSIRSSWFPGDRSSSTSRPPRSMVEAPTSQWPLCTS